jgi:hypothetical protein
LFATVALLLTSVAQAQIPAVHPLRSVHPAIAAPAPGLVVPSSPHVAAPDGLWNHGEGFAATVDTGGWHGSSDGTEVTIHDVHVNANDTFTANPAFSYLPDPLYPGSPVLLRRQEGYLRPAGVPLPNAHPLYGPVGSYVDQGAFELFRPQANWDGSKTILIIIHTKETAQFPLDYQRNRLEWRDIYRGYFSADGLVRPEVNLPRNQIASVFLATDAAGDVERPQMVTLARWNGSENYWPIEGYPVLSVSHRSTTLNEQRYMQLLRSIKLLLTVSDARNPIHPLVLTQQQVEQQVVVAFAGGSNGGMQSSLACLRHPRLVHGAYASAINPSYQRLYAEFDLERALSCLTGSGMGPIECTEDDFLTWNQYVWGHGLEMHDMSVLRHFFSGTAYRPFCFVVGDEDITSTGTNWIRIADGASWQASGERTSPSPFGGSNHTFAWTAGTLARHQTHFGPATNPYSGATEFWTLDIMKDFWPRVIAQRQATAGPSSVIPALLHEPRTAAQQLRGLDDPQEWWLGRPFDPPVSPAPGGELVADTVWNNAVNPGSSGCMPGGKEAMFIRDNRVYVGSADGLVSRFFVAPTSQFGGKQPLLRDAQSVKLGHACFALAPAGAGGAFSSVVAGTRRHLHLLDKNTLAVQSTVQLAWEVAEPHHLICADVLPGHAGNEIVCATIHGGVCFFDLALNPIFEWPEPGVHDLAFLDGALTILSARGVVARVTFDNADVPTLTAVSRAIPRQLLSWGAPVDFPCQGVPQDMEFMRLNFGPFGVLNAAISVWSGDVHGVEIRGHAFPALEGVPYLDHTLHPELAVGVVADIAVCSEGPASTAIGDHCLVLTNGEIKLFDQFRGFVGKKVLQVTSQPGIGYPFGRGAHRMAVGELVPASSANYTEEVVIATNTGLMWMHVQEIAAAGTLLPAAGTQAGAYQSGFWIEKNIGLATPLPETRVQARTNQCMQATWSLGLRPGAGSPNDGQIHVLDQRGAYWRIDGGGNVQLWEESPFAVGSRGWTFVGPMTGDPALDTILDVVAFGSATGLTTSPYCALNSLDVALELAPSALGIPYVQNNWSQRSISDRGLCNFVLHPLGGDVTPLAGGSGFEIWNWAADAGSSAATPRRDPFANLLLGYRFSSSGVAEGRWASTSRPNTSGDTKCPHHALRNYYGIITSLTQQSVAAVEMQQGVVVVLGCPGGRVRVVAPGVMQVSVQTEHVIGNTGLIPSPDFGSGGTAIAVRKEATVGGDRLRIWFSPSNSHDARPAGYGSNGSLSGAEVGSSLVYEMTWTVAGFSVPSVVADLHPTTTNLRGASAPMGMLLADLISKPNLPQYVGDELIVATASGDVIIYNISPGSGVVAERWRSTVPGGAGCYRGLLVADVDGGEPELYVAASSGLWRFKQP